nr:unnamed protein product [Digitaria exilis]
MADEKESTSIPLSQAAEAVDPEDPAKSPPRPSSPTNSTRKVRICPLRFFARLVIRGSIALNFIMHIVSNGYLSLFHITQACCAVLQSWVSRKFMTGCVVLFPVAVTFFITWWFIQFVDGFFSPLYAKLGIDIFDQNTTAFKEVAIIRHPRIGEYAFGFITSTVVLQVLGFDAC